MRGVYGAVVWNEESGTGSRQLFITVSSDNGATWSNAFSVADNGTTGPWPDPAAAYAANGDLFIVYRSPGTLAGENSISVMRLGQSSTSGPTTIVTGAVDARAPAVACGNGGLVLVSWAQVATGAAVGTRNDVWAMRSTNAGASWSWPARLSLPGTTTEGADAPDIAVQGSTAAVVFRTSITAPCG